MRKPRIVMAGALLGLKKLRVFMERNRLTLEQAEQGLRWEAELCLECRQDRDKGRKMKGLELIPWSKAKLGTFAPYGASKTVDSGDGEEAVPVDEEILMQETHRREEDKLKRRRSDDGADFRHLWSWLLDEVNKGQRTTGEKLRVILGVSEYSDLRTKRSCQLERDGETILGALEMLRKDPLKVRRTKKGSGSPAVQLAALSLEMQDRQDFEKTRAEEKLRKKLEKAQEIAAERRAKLAEAEAEVRLIEKELGHLTGERRPGKTGKRKRG